MAAQDREFGTVRERAAVERLNTDTQHMGYVLREGEEEPPAGLVAAFGEGHRLQDIVLEELRVGRTGNEVLAASATVPVPEWDDRKVSMALEEEAVIDAAGERRWVLRRQERLHLIR